MKRTIGSDTRIRAGIEFSGRTMRYAEVELKDVAGRGGSEPIDPGPRLLRLGACDFDFDVERAVLDPDAPTHLETVARAIADIYRGSTPTRFGVAVHPWFSTSFFAPLTAGMPAPEKLEQLRQEAAMLADVRLTRQLQVAAMPLRAELRPDGREYHWHHVLRVTEATHARLAYLAEQLRAGLSHTTLNSAGAVAEIMARSRSDAEREEEIESPASVPFALALGFYDERVEISLSRGTVWHFGHWAPAGDVADTLYFGAALLDFLKVEPGAIRRLFTYGDAAAPEPVSAFETLLGTEAVPLNPMTLFRLAHQQSDPGSLAAFAPCVGAAIKA